MGRCVRCLQVREESTSLRLNAAQELGVITLVQDEGAGGDATASLSKRVRGVLAQYRDVMAVRGQPTCLQFCCSRPTL